MEHCFGVIVKKYGVLEQPLQGWYVEEVKAIVDCCIILNNTTMELWKYIFQFRDEMLYEEEKGYTV